MKIRISLLTLCFFIWVGDAFAADIWAFSGYYKMLTSFSQTRDTEEDFYASLNRLRLEWKPKFTDHIDANLTYDHEFIFNDFSHTADFDLIRQNNQGNLASWDLDHTISDTDHVYEKHGLYRAYLRVTTDHTRTVIGKQLIDWGKMRSYSPLDIFNQPLPSSLEYDERVGFDAIFADIFSDEFSGINLIYGWGENADETSFGTRCYKKIGTYDTALILAKYREDDIVAGVGIDGYFMKAGLRAEYTYTNNGKTFFPRAALGVDYNFPHQVYAALEYFHNGAGNGDDGAFANSLKIQQNQLSLEKNLISLLIAYDLTPVWKLKGFVIYDIKGKSAFFNPEIRYNIRQNLDAAAGAQLFSASADSEFHGNQNLYYVEIKYFF